MNTCMYVPLCVLREILMVKWCFFRFVRLRAPSLSLSMKISNLFIFYLFIFSVKKKKKKKIHCRNDDKRGPCS